jgi:hypothetical protein
MEKRHTTTVLREMLREQVCCLGRIVARHQVPDDVVWEIAKGFDVIYQRARRQVEASPGAADVPPVPYRMEPHPGLTYLLEKLDVEAAAQAGEATRK